MITRIVKLTLLPNKIDAFIAVFNESNEAIKKFDSTLAHMQIIRKNQEVEVHQNLGTLKN